MGFLKPFLPLSSAAVFNRCMEDDLFDQFLMEKLVYIYRNSDLDVFQLGASEQINQVICALNLIFERCARQEMANLPEHIEHVIINLVHFSMSLWFSLEWQVCDLLKRCHLLQTLFRLEGFFSKISHLSSINWLYLKDLGVQPWSNPYFKQHLVKDPVVDATFSTAAVTALTRCEEDIDEQANEDDIKILRQEGLVIALLRLTKMFDAGGIEAVKSFSIRILSAWNRLQQRDGINDVPTEAKRCINMISHMYMMAVYEKDNVTGYDIDNMINDVRIYHKTIIDSEQNGKIIDDEFHDIVKTPAALIALTSVKMKQSFQDMAESVMEDLVRETSITRFGAVAHSYITYLLANILVDFSKQNVEDFDAKINTYTRLLHVYVREREKSERFALDESRKRRLLNTSCNITTNVRHIYNYKAAIGKGNRRSNLISEKSNNAYLFDMENEKRFDPVFQTMPYNKTVANEFYKILSKSSYKGWHYARLVLLLKIIDCELKEYNNWCYHPGLSTNFMLSLESKLSQRFEDLARIFEQHIFMEQEFWLTAFYFRPDEHLYNKVMSCGARYNRMLNYLNRGCLNEVIVKHSDKAGDMIPCKGDGENSYAFMNAKYGLLSSTYDVKQIANMTSKITAKDDYADLSKALRTLRLPENIIKDILTVTFSGRHANYTWAAEWSTLRKRCKALYQSAELKRKLVESNMAEANDRLKYLKIDYEKYQNLPQLDYGSIEEGYEGAYTNDGRKDDDDDDDDDDDEDDLHEKARNQVKSKVVVGRQTKNSTKDLFTSESEMSFDEMETEPSIKEFEMIDNNANPNKRSSARRAAAVIASAMLREDYYLKAPPAKKKEETKKSADSETSSNCPSATEDQSDERSQTPVSASTTSSFIAKVTENAALNKFGNMPNYWHRSTGHLADKPYFKKYGTKFPNITGLEVSTDWQPRSFDMRSESGTETDTEIPRKNNRKNSFQSYRASIETAKSASDVEMSDNNDDDMSVAALKALNERRRPSTTDYSRRSRRISSERVQILNVTVLNTNALSEQQPSSISSTPPTTPSNSSPIKQPITTPTKPAATKQTPPAKLLEATTMLKKQLSSKLKTTITANQKATMASATPTPTSTPQKLSTTTIENMVSPASATPITTTTAAPLTQSTTNVMKKTTPEEDYDDIINSSVVRFESKDTTKSTQNNTQARMEQQKQNEQIPSIPATASSRHQLEQSIIAKTSILTEAIATVKKEIATTSVLTEAIATVKKEIATIDEADTIEINKRTTASLVNVSLANAVEIKAQLETTEQTETTPTTDTKLSQEEKRKIQQKLIETLFRRKCCVRLKRICMKNYERQQRIPTVRIKRMNMQKYFEESSRSRSVSNSKSFDSEESKSSSPAPVLPPRRSAYKRRQPSTTPEESASLSSDEEYLPTKSKKRSTQISSISTASASTSSSPSASLGGNNKNEKATSSSLSLIKSIQQRNRRHNSAKNFSVVPRSASGMKVCISSSSLLRDVTPPAECIEIISSEDNDDVADEEQDPLPTCPIQFANVSMPLADFDDFEDVEEII